MKSPKGMSKTPTHRLIIADRSKAGMEQVANILEAFPTFKELEDRIEIWRASLTNFSFSCWRQRTMEASGRCERKTFRTYFK